MNNSTELTEFEIIAQFFSDIGCDTDQFDTSVSLGVGDDCALLSIPKDQRLAVSVDTLLAGRHFPENAAPFSIAQRALAVAISDLAAMGARPLAFTLALSLPDADAHWLQQFSQGLRNSAEYYRISLIGGDTTRGPLSVTIQVHGLVPEVTCLRRSGALLGDLIFVTGNLGDAAAAVDVFHDKISATTDQEQFFTSRFYQPQARLAVGETLLGVANAAIDISDGLLADLGHIVDASAVAATIYSEKLPLSNTLTTTVGRDQAQRYALTGGDDYELCFTANAMHTGQLEEYAELFDVPITAIGEIVPGRGVTCLNANRQVLQFANIGYQHF